MRKIYAFLALLSIAAVVSGCASTGSTILEFDAAGNVVTETRTSESVLHTLVSSTKEKSVVMWEDGFTAYISVSGGTVNDPTPHGKIFTGKTNKGFISVHPTQQGVAGIAKTIQATKNDLHVNLEGVSSSSSEMQSGVPGTTDPGNTDDSASE